MLKARRLKTLKLIIFPCLLGLFCLGASLLILHFERAARKEREYQEVSEKAQEIGAALERRLYLCMQVLKGLEAFARYSPDFTAKDFEGFARHLLNDNPEIRSLQLAPQGVVEFIHPIAGNEEALGHRLLDDTKTQEMAHAAILNGTTTIAGPYHLKQGGLGLVIRRPVYREEGLFWGFAIAVVDFPRFFRESGALIPPRTCLSLMGVDGKGLEGGMMLGDRALKLDNPVQRQIRLPSGSWVLLLAPAQGWGRGRLAFSLWVLGAIIGSLGIWALSFGYLRQTALLRVAEEDKERIFELSMDMLCIASFEGRFLKLNPAWEKTLGWAESELMARPWLDFVHPDDRGATEAAGLDLAQGKTVINFENRYRCADGSYRWLSWLSWPDNDRGVIIAATRDVSDKKALEERLRALAATDPLTGLANRRAFIERGNSELESSRRYGHPLSLLMMDIDLFKDVNDRYGHLAGDLSLKALAAVCAASLRSPDLMARIGGEEFAVILPHTSSAEALAMADRLRDTIAGLSIQVEGGAISFTVSLGVASLGGEEDDLYKLQGRADKALYASKASGRNKVSFH